MFKNLESATEFIDDFGLDWLAHTCVPYQDTWYQDHNTVHYMLFDKAIPQYIIDTAKANFTIFSTSIIKQNPGMVIPEHSDTYYMFKKKHGIDTEIVRWCIFLQDWQPGHYFDLKGKPMLEWKKGDYVELKEGILHRGSNSGLNPKYTAQITGVKK